MATHFRCNSCGTIFTLPRRKKKLRKRGHVKTLWCWKCENYKKHTLLGG